MAAPNHHELGVQACREGRLADALSLLDRSLLERETSERWNDWATVQLLSSRHAEAEVGYRRALQLEAGNAEAAENLGALLASSARALEALRCLEGLGERSQGAEQLRALCREAAAEQAPSDATVEQMERRLARAVSIQGGAVASLLLRAVALESALSGLAAGEGNAPAPVREDRADNHTGESVAEAASRVSAHTSALNSVALRLLAIEGRLAELSTRALRERQPAAKALWRGSLPSESSAKTLAAAPEIQLLAIHGVDGNTSVLELALLASLAHFPTPARYLSLARSTGAPP